MAISLSPKAAGEIVRYTWTPAIVEGDGLAGYTLTETGCTIDSDSSDGNEVAFFVSGGTVGTTASIVATATTDDGEDLEETLYLPIRATAAALANTARDVVSFALRKVFGFGEDAGAEHLSDGIEQLNMMLAEWRIDGLDIGISGPLEAADTLTIADEYLPAVKNNLLVVLAENYGREVSPMAFRRAEDGKRLVATRLLDMADLAFEPAILPRCNEAD